MGERRVTADGRILEKQADGRIIQVGGGAQQMPVDPTFSTKGPKAEADLMKTGADITAVLAGIENDRLRRENDERKRIADLRSKGFDENGNPIPGWQPKGEKPPVAEQGTIDATTRRTALQQWQGAGMLSGMANELDQKYRGGPGLTKGIAGLQDFLPTETNQSFNRAASAARGNVVQALGLIGSAVNSPGEATLWTAPYIPDSSDYDNTIEESIQRLRSQRDNARDTAIKTLGGVPDRNGNIHPLGTAEGDRLLAEFNAQTTGEKQNNNPPRIDMPGVNGGAFLDANGGVGFSNANPTNTGGGGGSFAVAAGKTREETDKNLSRMVEGWIKQGLPIDSINERILAFGGKPVDAASYGNVREYLKNNPNYSGFVNVSRTVENPVSARIAASEPGAIGAGVANMGSFGTVEALFPEQYAAQGQLNPKSQLGGEVIGSIFGANAIKNLGKAGIKKFAPRLPARMRLALGKDGSVIASNIAADTAYGGAYGTVTEGDPVSGAIYGGLGSGLGTMAGKTVAKGLRGLVRDPNAQKLIDAGVPLSVASQMGGRAKAFEDAATSMPLVGDQIVARRQDSMSGLVDAVLNRSGSHIGADTSGKGIDALPDMFQKNSDYYDQATAGHSAVGDPTFKQDILSANGMGAQLPDDLAAKFNLAIQNRVAPAFDANGMITGDAYQQATRGLKAYKSEYPKSGFEQDYRSALSFVQNALRSLMERQGGQNLSDGLANADRSYRGLKIVQKAKDAALNGSGSGIPGLPTPAQLNKADLAAANKFGGDRMFADILDPAQTVIPSKTPDSGTARRLLINGGALTAIGGAGGGASYASEDPAPAIMTLGGTAALALAGSKSGQKMLSKLLFERSKALVTAGKGVDKRLKYISPAALPFLYPSQ
jgi:hypothetical protein